MSSRPTTPYDCINDWKYYNSSATTATETKLVGCNNPNSDTSNWCLLPAYHSGNTAVEGKTYKKITNPDINKMDSDCMTNWRYLNTDGTILYDDIIPYTTNLKLDGTTGTESFDWCPTKSYIKDNKRLENRTFKYCNPRYTEYSNNKLTDFLVPVVGNPYSNITKNVCKTNCDTNTNCKAYTFNVITTDSTDSTKSTGNCSLHTSASNLIYTPNSTVGISEYNTTYTIGKNTNNESDYELACAAGMYITELNLNVNSNSTSNLDNISYKCGIGALSSNISNILVKKDNTLITNKTNFGKTTIPATSVSKTISNSGNGFRGITVYGKDTGITGLSVRNEKNELLGDKLYGAVSDISQNYVCSNGENLVGLKLGIDSTDGITRLSGIKCRPNTDLLKKLNYLDNSDQMWVDNSGSNANEYCGNNPTSNECKWVDLNNDTNAFWVDLTDQQDILNKLQPKYKIFK